VLSLLVTASLLGLPLRADERWYPYLFGPQRLRAPWTVVTWPLESIDGYLALGNFRPLGRMIEHANYLVQHLLAILTGLPMHVVLGVVRMLLVTVVVAATVWLADAVAALHTGGSRDRRQRLGIWVGAAIPGLVVASGNGSSVVLFSGLYFTSALVVVLIARAFARPVLYEAAPRSARRLLIYGVLGMVVAATNELVYLAAPTSAAVAVVGLWLRRCPPRVAASLPVMRAGLASGAGFVLVFVPSRLAIARACSESSCYANSSVDLSGWDPSLWAARAVSGLPMPAWWWQRYLLRREPLWSIVLVLVALALAAAATVAWRSRSTADAGAEPGWWRPAVAVLAVGLTVVASSALLSSLSEPVQAGLNPFAGWRETSVSVLGWGLALGSGAMLLTSGPRLRAPRVGLATAVLGAAIAVSIGANAAKPIRDARDPRTVLADRIATEVASFGDDDTHRCALLEEFAVLHPDRPDQHALLRRALDRSTTQRYGEPFCRGATG
jgi:hypothetical protein